MKQPMVEQHFPMLISVFAEKAGIKVKLGGDRAYTDGKTIHMPYPTSDTMDLSYAFAGHESEHCNDSDFEVVKAFLAKHNQCGVAKHILNVLEDTRIELNFLQRFTGTRGYFEELAKYIAGNFTPDNVDLYNYFFMYSRGKLMGYEYTTQCYQHCKTWIESEKDARFIAELNSVLDSVLGSKSTSEVADISDRVIEILKAEQEKENQPEPQSPSDGQPDDGDSTGDSEGDGEGNSEQSDDGIEGTSGTSSDEADGDNDGEHSGTSGSDSKEQDDGEHSGTGCSDSQDQDDGATQSSMADEQDCDGQSGHEDGESQNASDSETSDNSTSSTSNPGSSKIVNAMFDSEGDDHMSDVGDFLKDVLSQEENIDREMESAYSGHAGVMHDYIATNHSVSAGNLINDTAAVTAVLRTKLNGLVSHASRTLKSVGKKGRRLSAKRYHRVQSGNLNVFTSKQRSTFKPNAKVVVLVDDSGSIGGNLLDQKRSAYALIDTLSGVKGVDVSAFSFGAQTANGISRLKSFAEPATVAAPRVEGLCAGGGNTPLLPALYASIKDFALAKADKKSVLIVITDGVPNELNTCISKLNEMRSHGIETIGVGVGAGVDSSKMRSQFGANQVIIPNFADLPKHMMKLSQEVIFNQ
ncbi:VWA domain-containing protein [Vibrio agarivorans]|uniref:VWA domain-containing protein n=1 Tax=Vibrio agarivorans TaxID=153622 RepID=A0ABT7Y7B7_9VIBR|nr:VWA domain-containing protein [Vibrio agarivorans]MDN2483956.1 VWA domain-containing protein [Vibrio agarivorans]